MQKSLKIGILGTGKLAWQISQAIDSTDHEIYVVYGRRLGEAKKLATKLDCSFTDQLTSLRNNTDLLIIAVSDDSIQTVAEQIPAAYTGIVVHTSGSVSSEALNSCKNRGIFYPLYSFNSKRKIKFDKIPLLITSDHKEILVLLENLARSITSLVYHIGDEQRRWIHLSAVYANNYTNFMMTQAFEILRTHQIPEELMLPIIRQSSKNWNSGKSKAIQTGPAIRKDEKTIQKHLDLIENKKEQQLYKDIAEAIQRFYQ